MRMNICFYSSFLSLLLITVLAGLANLNQHSINLKFDVILVGTNDIHGTAYPVVLSRKDTG